MTLTTAVLIACALAFATKAIGYAIPPRLVEGERTMRVSTLQGTAVDIVGRSEVLTQSTGRGEAGFITVVIAGAVTAGLLRLIGIG